MSEFAGTLTERIAIERPTAERTPMGLQQPGWEPVLRCLAGIAAEGFGPEGEAMAYSSMQRFRVSIRRREGIAVDQRIKWKGRLLMIRQLLEDPRQKDRIVMRCEEVRQ